MLNRDPKRERRTEKGRKGEVRVCLQVLNIILGLLYQINYNTAFTRMLEPLILLHTHTHTHTHTRSYSSPHDSTSPHSPHTPPHSRSVPHTHTHTHTHTLTV